VAALRQNPRVALAVDRPGMPLRSLLVRGSASVEMAVITITPDHVVLHDFGTTIPEAVADLIAAHGDPR
jgi:hypothetical protein